MALALLAAASAGAVLHLPPALPALRHRPILVPARAPLPLAADVPVSNTPSKRRDDFSVAALLVSAMLNLLGFTLLSPLNPQLGASFGLPVGASLGSLSSVYPLGMLAGLFLWPTLSDRVGRKPIICLSLLGSGLGLGAQAWAVHHGWRLTTFLALRCATGCFSGASPVSKARS